MLTKYTLFLIQSLFSFLFDFFPFPSFSASFPLQLDSFRDFLMSKLIRKHRRKVNTVAEKWGGSGGRRPPLSASPNQPTNQRAPCWPYSGTVMRVAWAALRQQWYQKHGGVHRAAAGCKRSPRLIPSSGGFRVSPRRRGGRPGFRGNSAPPLRVQIQLQGAAFVPERRRDPVLDPHWK